MRRNLRPLFITATVALTACSAVLGIDELPAGDSTDGGGPDASSDVSTDGRGQTTVDSGGTTIDTGTDAGTDAGVEADADILGDADSGTDVSPSEAGDTGADAPSSYCQAGDLLETTAPHDTESTAQIIPTLVVPGSGKALVWICGTAGPSSVAWYKLTFSGDPLTYSWSAFQSEAPYAGMNIKVNGTEYAFNQSGVTLQSEQPFYFRVNGVHPNSYRIKFELTAP